MNSVESRRYSVKCYVSPRSSCSQPSTAAAFSGFDPLTPSADANQGPTNTVQITDSKICRAVLCAFACTVHVYECACMCVVFY